MLNFEIQAASVNGEMEAKLKSKDFLNVERWPTITFKTTKVVQTSRTTFDVAGMFTMRGVSKPATLNLVIADQDVGTGYAQGTLSFDRKDFGIPSNRKGDDSVEVDVNLKVEQVSGPALVRKKYR
jgi:polyisoprenoid-binding protein YceI